jgi:hypothetical protein
MSKLEASPKAAMSATMSANMSAKPRETTAPATAFCRERIEGPSAFLWIDGNGKITAQNGSLDDPKPNAFSLVEIDDCPGSTGVCRESCYVHGIRQYSPETHELYIHNSRTIREILAGGHSDEWAAIFADYIARHCAGGFRWHVSGDIFSLAYAQWIARVCALSASVRHWIYTRSFEYVAALHGIPNLTVNLSCDSENYRRARVTHADFPKTRLCFLTRDGDVPPDLDDGSVIFPDYRLRGGNEAGQVWFEGLTPQYKSFVCPVDFHGKAENRRCGPCDRCLIAPL